MILEPDFDEGDDSGDAGADRGVCVHCGEPVDFAVQMELVAAGERTTALPWVCMDCQEEAGDGNGECPACGEYGCTAFRCQM